MRNIFMISLALLLSTPVISQEESVLLPNDLNWKFSVAIVPQYAIVSGMRLDFDFKIGDHQYLTLAPQGYYNKKYTQFYPDQTDMKGMGLNVNYRFIYSKTANPGGPYIGFGLVYKYFDLSYFGNEWVDYMEYGNTYRENVNHKINKQFNQFGYDLLLGYQETYERFFFDFYLGWGFRLSDFEEENTGDTFWGETVFDPGYSGFLPTIGLRLGIFMR